MLNIQIRPISKWPGKLNTDPKSSPFRCGYKETLKLLEYELGKCGARLSSLVLEMQVNPREIRLDGQLQADARIQGPAIIFRFVRETNIRRNPKDPSKWICDPQNVSYPCDAFDSWKDNLRAIALSMERLRSVELINICHRKKHLFKSDPDNTNSKVYKVGDLVIRMENKITEQISTELAKAK